MADFEDSLGPGFARSLEGHLNLIKAIDLTIYFTDDHNKKTYFLKKISSQVFLRPRNLVREEPMV